MITLNETMPYYKAVSEMAKGKKISRLIWDRKKYVEYAHWNPVNQLDTVATVFRDDLTSSVYKPSKEDQKAADWFVTEIEYSGFKLTKKPLDEYTQSIQQIKEWSKLIHNELMSISVRWDGAHTLMGLGYNMTRISWSEHHFVVRTKTGYLLVDAAYNTTTSWNPTQQDKDADDWVNRTVVGLIEKIAEDNINKIKPKTVNFTKMLSELKPGEVAVNNNPSFMRFGLKYVETELVVVRRESYGSALEDIRFNGHILNSDGWFIENPFFAALYSIQELIDDRGDVNYVTHISWNYTKYVEIQRTPNGNVKLTLVHATGHTEPYIMSESEKHEWSILRVTYN